MPPAARSEVLRAFIAADLTPAVRQAVAQVSQRLQHLLEGLPLRWVAPENMHLTLKFLGDVSARNLRLLEEMLAGEVAQHTAFEFGVGTLGAFPSDRHPRVVWVGVSGPEALQRLHQGIENAMARLGYPREQRPYQPHLTLARVARNAPAEVIRRVSQVVRTERVGYLGSVHVDAVHLYRSDLSPRGPRYTRLFTAPLASDRAAL